MRNSVEIGFSLSGTSIAPKEISEILGVVPDVALLRGERNSQLDLPRTNIWALRSTVRSNEVADHWHELELLIGDKRDVVASIAVTGRASFTIIINSAIRVPSIQIPPAMSFFAGFINAVIDIDHLQS